MSTPEGPSLPGSTETGGFDLDDRSAPGRVAFAMVSDQPISVEWCVDNVTTSADGAVVTFSGIVRNHDDGRGVTRLSYSGHPSAPEVMRQVADDVAAAHPGTRLAVAHRVGDLEIGDVALACAVSAAHRGSAFAACAALVDEVKARVPIWKEQFFTDGTAEWVGSIG
ncbi:MAG: molybdopterin synthase catalytic subunit [Subtercola sp.]|nr:molybdopterin synthase catalytic subunit [Subtercola sp.]